MSAESGIFIPISDLKQIIRNSPDLLEEQRDELIDQLKQEDQLKKIETLLGIKQDPRHETDFQTRIEQVQSEIEDIAGEVVNLEATLASDIDSRKSLSTRLANAVEDVGKLKETLESFEGLERGLPAIVRAVMTATTNSLVVTPLTPKQRIQLRFELNKLGFDFNDNEF